MQVRLRALGQCLIEVGEARIGPEADRLFGTLLYLTMERGTRLPRQSLVDLIWPESEPERGRHSFRQVLYRLRLPDSSKGPPADAGAGGGAARTDARDAADDRGAAIGGALPARRADGQAARRSARGRAAMPGAARAQ